MTRRQWLARFFWSVTALVTAGVATPLVGYFVGPLLRRGGASRVRLGQLSDFARDRPQRVDFVVRRRDGWVVEEGRRTAWVVRRGDEIVVFDPRCTHLSCAYQWHADFGLFICPCHDGRFDVQGRVVGGPAPRSLDTYTTTIEDGIVYVLPIPRSRYA